MTSMSQALSPQSLKHSSRRRTMRLLGIFVLVLTSVALDRVKGGALLKAKPILDQPDFSPLMGMGGNILSKRIPYYENIWPFSIYRKGKSTSNPMVSALSAKPKVRRIVRKVVAPVDICFSGFPLHCFKSFRKASQHFRKDVDYQ